MEKVLFIIAASALCAGSPPREGRYFFVNEEKSWTEARSYCREKYTDLAAVTSQEDVDTLNNMAELKNVKAWIGLYNGVRNWAWSMTNVSKDMDGFGNWAPGEPNYNVSKVLCAVLCATNDTGEWKAAACEQGQSSVCYDVSSSNTTFVFVDKKMSWTEAQSYCREHHTDLASVRSSAENQEVNKTIPLGQSAWISLFRHSWKWVGGNNFSFSYWVDQEQGGATADCGAANFADSGKWENSNCNEMKTFICYAAPFTKQVVRLRLERSSSVDLNNPDVQKDLLKKLQQKLKDKGVDGDIKLSWRKHSNGKFVNKEETTT